jgi:hypothetical protein
MALLGRAVVCYLALGAGAAAQVQNGARPSVRVTARVDDRVTAGLARTHPAVVARATGLRHLDAGTLLTHMQLVLKASDEQELALVSLLDEQQDKGSASFHRWLTPETFGAQFGVAPADVAQVTAWLGDQGFKVESVSKSNRVVTFSGTSGKVETAFHTQMSRMTVDGEPHISNTTDLAVPAALAPVIKGVASLNDFFPRAGAKAQTARQVQLPRLLPPGNYVAANAEPQYGSSATGTHYVAPGDAATIYNTTPLLNAGIDGTGVTIAVLARSNITLSDVQAFRTLFGLKTNNPNILVIGQDPGQNADDIEAYLDAEWTGAMAPGATVDFLVGGPSLVSQGIDTAGLYAVDSNIGDVISLSYGGCEGSNGASGTAFWNDLWEQAAAQGQSVFVSSGDSSAAGCDASNASYATGGYGVNGLGSSAYNVSVGGSMFVDFGPAQYWGASSTIPYATALSYIPEAPWNQGLLSTTYLNSASTATQTGSGIGGGGGGISIYTARPAWQTGSGISAAADPTAYSGTGIASGSPITGVHRLDPDVVNIAANGHDGTLFCAEGLCSLTASGGLNDAGIVGGTSVAAPTMAGIQGLIDAKNGGRQGNPNFYYYALANAQYTASTTACQSKLGTAAAPTVTLPGASCNFHDIVSGSNVVPTDSSGSTAIGFLAGVGFDAASGLGSMNVANVADNWSTVTFAATTTSFTITPAAGINHGAAQTIAVTVKPAAGTGTPTGNFSLIAETTTPNGPFTYTLTNGSFSGTVSSGLGVANGDTGAAMVPALPAGSYNVYVHYAGDGTYAASNSAAVPVTIGTEASKVSLRSENVTTGGSAISTSSFAYGALVYVDTQVQGASGSGTPTGTVTYTITRNGLGLSSLMTSLDTYGNTYLEAAQSIVAFYMKANYGALSPGSYVVTAAYSGDTNFQASSSTVSFTIAQETPTVTYTGTAHIASGGTATFNYSIANATSVANPTSTVAATGTVTFTDTTASTVLGTGTLSNGAVVFSSTGITTSGANTITASYSGDTNYAAANSTVTVTVGTLTSTTTTVAAVSGTVGSSVTLSATVSPAAAGTMYFYANGVYVGSGTSSASTGTATLRYALFTGGTQTITAVFGGTASYGTSSGTGTATIAKKALAIAISAPLNSVYGGTAALGINLTGAGGTSSAPPSIVVTGTVTFYAGGTAVGSCTPYYVLNYEQYACSANVTTLPVGSDTIDAVYSGDANYAGVTSVNNTTTVAKLTPVIVVSAPATVYAGGASVPLTATMVLASNLAAPTAMVGFYADGTLLGSSGLSYSVAAGGYVATYTATGLAGGVESITAVYPGDANYNMVTSAADAITVTTNTVWIANGNNSVSALSEAGSAVTSGGVSGGGIAVAIDGAGDVWALNQGASSVAEFSKEGAVISSGYTGGGINAPTALAIDGAGQVWVANGNNTLSVLDSTGAAVSSSAYTSVISTPTSVSVDGSGNVWITNSGSNSVTQVIGVAAPVTTPQTTAVKNSTVGSRP